MKGFLILIICVVLAGWCKAQEATTILVDQNGSGDFKTLQDALDHVRAFSGRKIIKLAPGIYNEKIEVHSWTPQVSIIGTNAQTTIIVFNDYSGKGSINTFTSYTAKIMGNDFYAEKVTFQNNAGPVGQAVALHVEGDRCVFKDCRFIGDQDTIYTGGDSRQYFINCYIEGTTDFIFGAATVVFERCTLHSKKNSYITAASTTQGKEFGYVFLNCTLTASGDVTNVYLGRPWRSYAKTVFVDCNLGAHILAEGWHNWNKPEAEALTFYAEYNSTGAGANVAARVHWSHQLTQKQKRKYTVANILKGHDGWLGEVKQ